MWAVRRWLIPARSNGRRVRCAGRAASTGREVAGAGPRSDPAAGQCQRGDGKRAVAAAARLPGHRRRHGRGLGGKGAGGSHRGCLVADRPASVVGPGACRTRGAGSLARGLGGHCGSRQRARRSGGADRRQRNRCVLARRRPLALAHAGGARAGLPAGQPACVRGGDDRVRRTGWRTHRSPGGDRRRSSVWPRRARSCCCRGR